MDSFGSSHVFDGRPPSLKTVQILSVLATLQKQFALQVWRELIWTHVGAGADDVVDAEVKP